MMKSRQLNNLLIGCIALFTLTASCKKDDGPKSKAEGIVQNGSWHISKYTDTGIDSTSQFTGYSFTFNESGSVNANKGTDNYNGNWHILDSSNVTAENLYLIIDFNLTNELADLNEDWFFLLLSDSKLELNDLNGNNLGNQYLTFEQN
ncbi:hypothetical protein K6119_08195 [Paracrocinitomix mangrovi]|uniref:hypothetical protein n=1 Tax=Paracrocinitomix mangrovi TaxID=2862509 RepID=UPI001C8E5B04|nr:hypothetical protein [Paracrocinitomix mangrovi]UKN03493.1 hypothetical protein K6119_08195 [Paracrocinitomix mangrovi]